MFTKNKIYSILSIATCLTTSTIAFARVDTGAEKFLLEKNSALPEFPQNYSIQMPKMGHSSSAPESAKKINLFLKKVKIQGVTTFTQDEMLELYKKHLNKNVSLEVAWTIMADITKKYKDAGYFLSRAYVPQQSIKDGEIVINVVEGYIDEVELPEKLKSSTVIQKYISRLLKNKPAKIGDLESFLLRINDLPGISVRSILSPKDKNNEDYPAITVTLKESEEANKKGLISVDNFSSRTLGVQEASASYDIEVIPLNKTNVSVNTSLPLKYMTYAGISHNAAIYPDFMIGVNANVIKSKPGYNTKYLELKGDVSSFGVNLNYQHIRQRDKNLSFKVNFDMNDSKSTIFSKTNPIVQSYDHVRALRVGAQFSMSDKWHGTNNASLTVSQGVPIFGNNKANDLTVSKSGAKPTFTKATFSLARLQEVYNDFELYAASQSQIASGKLYYTEQFGYGGQVFGRAYDSFEITGDRGIKGLIELRYKSFNLSENFNLFPYGYYDIGAAWGATTTNQVVKQSASSIGAGFRFNTKWNQSGMLGVAWPLTKKVNSPIYGGSSKAPRISVQFTQSF